jgi:N-acyl-L-homoserine lactone synthetase
MVTFAQAKSSRQLHEAFEVRYRVYCVERGYEDARAFPDGLESDAWDASSWHFLCYGDDGRPVGTVRLIPASPASLPIEQHCEITHPDWARMRNRSAEISRLAITRRYRREEDGDGLPLALLGLIRAAYQQCLLAGRPIFLAAMNRRLQVLLRRHGIRFEPIGPPVEYRGTRTPHALAGWDLERECPRRRPDVYRFLREGIPPELTAESLRAPSAASV